MLLSARALARSHSLQISWPVSGETFALEYAEGLSLGKWQAVTNAAVTSSNQVTVLIDTSSGIRFLGCAAWSRRSVVGYSQSESERRETISHFGFQI